MSETNPHVAPADWSFPEEGARRARHLAMIALRVAASFVLAFVLMSILMFALGGLSLWLVVVLATLYGWLLFVFFHYRYLRQNEVVYLLAAAAEVQQPLAPALWAYLVDRPRGALREVVVAVLLSLVYWGWIGRDTFDRKTRKVALLLEAGMPLHLALRAVPGVAARETVLAAAVGQATGQLAPCLRRVPQWRVATLWLELLPRFLYPLIVLLVLVAILSFQMVFIIPKFEKIFADFKLKLPDSTNFLIDTARVVVRYWLIPLGILLLLPVTGIWYVCSLVRWYTPVLGRFYRMHIQSRTLKMLGLLLETGQPVPQALDILLRSGYFWGTARRRVSKVRDGVEGGAPLARQLENEGLLPGAMVPLLESAEKAQNLPWILSELGEHLARRMSDKAHRFAMTMFPLTILGLGLVVGFVMISLFMPLLRLIESLGG